MAKKRRLFTDETIKKMIEEGYGKGEGALYKPWISTRSLSSLGRCSEISGWKSHRIHHLLSKLETNYFYHLEWADSITDIREQYPLLDEFDSYKETMDIALAIGVKYPIVPKTRTPNVMTTDFLITKKVNGKTITIARTTKYAKDLSKKRAIEKLEIERIFWERRGVDWGIVTENEINNSLAFNVEYLYKSKTLLGFASITPELIQIVNNALYRKQAILNLSFAKLTSVVDEDLGLESGTSLFIAKHLIANKLWIIDITKKIDTAKPLEFKLALSKRKEQVV